MPFEKGFLNGIKPDEILTISEWADEYRVLPSEGSAEPGIWRTNRTPYLKEIMDELSPQSPTKEVVFIKGTQIGAPLSLDTPIPTIDGWTTMGDIKVGNKVFDENGNVCDVNYVTPIFYNRDCYEITFSDGNKIIADSFHRWFVHRYVGKTFKRYEEQVTTTGEMIKDFKQGKRNRYAIPVTKPLKLEEKILPVHPYLIGLWLGDGNRHSNRITIENKDSDEVVKILRKFGVYCEVTDKHSKGNATEIIFKPYKKEGYCKRGHKLSEVGTINGRCRKCHNQRSAYYQYGTKIDDVIVEESYYKLMKEYKIAPYKRLPDFYLRASEIQRRYLLAGLIDSDGHINKNGYVEFYNIDEKIADYVFELAASLGYKSKKVTKKHKDSYLGNHLIKVSTNIIYVVRFLAYKEDGIVSLLQRKSNNLKSKNGGNVRITETYRRRVVDIKKINSVPVRCIGVNSENHLFLAGKFMVPTHNTELGNNVLFYYADLHPCPMLQVLHTEDIARTHSKTKIWPSIEVMRLSEKIKRAAGSSSGSTTTELVFPGGNWKIGWAQTKSTFASVSRRIVVGDDVDRWPLDVGGEGNPVELLKKRTDAFANRKIYINSTPTVKGASNIEKEFNESDQRHFYLPCPKCGEFIIFEKENFIYEYDDETYELKGDVKYKCSKCGELIEEWNKTEMLKQGKWVAHNSKSTKKGYRLPSFYSPVGWLSWDAIFKEYLSALRQQNKYGNDEYMKVWENTRNAKVFEPQQKEQNFEKIFELEIDLEEGLVPEDTKFLVMAVDVQKDHFWYEVRALQYGNRKHILRAGRVENWANLEDIFRSYYLDKNGNKYFIKVCGIDSGFNTAEVYEFCAMNSDVCIPVKGKDKMTNPWVTSDAMRKQDGVSIATGLKVYTLNTEYFKDMLYNSITRTLKLKEKGEISDDNIITLHKNISKTFAKQYTSEHKIVEVNKKGREIYKWEKVNSKADNHLWDCGVYNTFLGELLGIRFFRKTETQIRKKIKSKRKRPQISENYLDDF